MKICKYCGSLDNNNTTTCRRCGAMEFDYVCDNCGTIYQTGLICPHCGVRHGQKPIQCPNCGTLNYTKTCTTCGYDGLKTQKQIINNTNTNISGEHNRQSTTTNPKQSQPQQKKRHSLLWIIGWIFIFPVPLTILLKRNKKIPNIIRTIVLSLVWMFYLLVVIVIATPTSTSTTTPTSTTAATVATAPIATTAATNQTYTINQTEESTSVPGNIKRFSSVDRKNEIAISGYRTTEKTIDITPKDKNRFFIDDVIVVSEDPNIAIIEKTKLDNYNMLHYYIRAINPGTTNVYFSSTDGKVISNKIEVKVFPDEKIHINSREEAIYSYLIDDVNAQLVFAEGHPVFNDPIRDAITFWDNNEKISVTHNHTSVWKVEDGAYAYFSDEYSTNDIVSLSISSHAFTKPFTFEQCLYLAAEFFPFDKVEQHYYLDEAFIISDAKDPENHEKHYFISYQINPESAEQGIGVQGNGSYRIIIHIIKGINGIYSVGLQDDIPNSFSRLSLNGLQREEWEIDFFEYR